MPPKKENPKLLPLKRRLGSNQTRAEQLLWMKLRQHQIHGMKFRRQHGIGSYIVDFFCPERNLVIEVVDRDVHADNTQQRKDSERERYLRSLGLRVVRYTNDEVIHDLDGVLENLYSHVSEVSTSPSPSLQRRDLPNPNLSGDSRFATLYDPNAPPTKEGKFQGKLLPREFYDRPTLKVAKDLLGKVLVTKTTDNLRQSKIVDVEAYIGPKDKACHASKGRTKRTEVMFGPAGFTYVYLIYGMYHCLNIVTEGEDYPAAILIRGLEIFGNSHPTGTPTRIDGPGRVCRYLEVDRTHNCLDATHGATLWIEDHGLAISRKQILALPRVGVDYAGEWAKKLWRFGLLAPASTKSRRTKHK